jgi:hypothetical protein
LAKVVRLKERRAFTAAEARALARALRAGEAASCPRCGAVLAASEVRKPPDVAYVRTRTLLICTDCGASGAVDG